MDAKLKAKWVKALRSGKYKQGNGRLKVSIKPGHTVYCCLGVLRDICAPGSRASMNGEGHYLSDIQLKRFGGLTNEQQERLAEMNDGETGINHTFKGIATYIEKNL